ncbi:hypothetical protein AVEN_260579-1 [Araneus ventricosus]|uniref:Uncharacterized protein n=1 Tax=Araneus ventricosus TaxID=182803 RepID=A0A4Y2M5A7_ARAVE|nr:hypothetical protein AVEN_260579-1 [Araneus ventricosus]
MATVAAARIPSLCVCLAKITLLGERSSFPKHHVTHRQPGVRQTRRRHRALPNCTNCGNRLPSEESGSRSKNSKLADEWGRQLMGFYYLRCVTGWGDGARG